MSYAPSHDPAPTIRGQAAPLLDAADLPAPVPAPLREPWASWEIGPGAVVGNHVLGPCLGEGGMGTVYAARHRILGRPAAVKILHADLLDTTCRARMLQEAWIVDQIQHPNVVEIYDVGFLDDGRPYIAMELLDGENLADRLARGRPTWRQGAEIVRQVAEALAAAHVRGFVHRDLKPGNVFLLERDGRLHVKLLDWGIARVEGAPWLPARLTHRGWVVGTPQYMAPEQSAGREVDGRADVYSLGVIAYELFLGMSPVGGMSPLEIAANHACADPVAPRLLWPQIPRLLDRLLLSMVAKKPERRPPIADIAPVLDSLAIELERLELGTAAPAPVTRWRWRLVAAAATVALALAAAAVLHVV